MNPPKKIGDIFKNPQQFIDFWEKLFPPKKFVEYKYQFQNIINQKLEKLRKEPTSKLTEKVIEFYELMNNAPLSEKYPKSFDFIKNVSSYLDEDSNLFLYEISSFFGELGKFFDFGFMNPEKIIRINPIYKKIEEQIIEFFNLYKETYNNDEEFLKDQNISKFSATLDWEISDFLPIFPRHINIDFFNNLGIADFKARFFLYIHLMHYFISLIQNKVCRLYYYRKFNRDNSNISPSEELKNKYVKKWKLFKELYYQISIKLEKSIRSNVDFKLRDDVSHPNIDLLGHSIKIQKINFKTGEIFLVNYSFEDFTVKLINLIFFVKFFENTWNKCMIHFYLKTIPSNLLSAPDQIDFNKVIALEMKEKPILVEIKALERELNILNPDPYKTTVEFLEISTMVEGSEKYYKLISYFEKIEKLRQITNRMNELNKELRSLRI